MKKIAHLAFLLLNGLAIAQQIPTSINTTPFQIGVTETITSKELSETEF